MAYYNGIRFTWAQNANGNMVHVDSVPQGLDCNCICPNCKERLLARHGNVRAHGFAHHSETRGANLKICYMVILYKLAEQIILQRKKIYAPSYYGIFKESILDFAEVKVDSRYDREDKQPDVIATTNNGKQYLIEFTFDYKIQRTEPIDYKNLNCLEIDLSNQTLETLEDFLIHSNEDRRWLNNQEYFDAIETTYAMRGKSIRIKDESECASCQLRHQCCSVKIDKKPLIINNSGRSYRLCKPEEVLKAQKAVHRMQFIDKARHLKGIDGLPLTTSLARETVNYKNIPEQLPIQAQVEPNIPPELRTCFMCRSNLDWMCRDHTMAHCGPYPSMGVPKNTPPDTAKTCKGFKAKPQ